MGDEVAIMSIHVCQSSGVVRKTSPPHCTMMNCPTRMMPATIHSVYDFLKFLNADSLVPNTRALKRFHNCIITKMVKNTVNPSTSSILCVFM